MFFTSEIIDLMLSLSLSLLTSYLSICSILKRFVVSCMTFLLILRLGKFFCLFTYSSDVHTYNTRFSDAGNFYVNKSRLSVRLNSFFGPWS